MSPLVFHAIAANAEHGHHHVMSSFRRGLGLTPRAETGALWFLDRTSRRLIVRSAEPPLNPGLLGAEVSVSVVETPAGGESLTLTVARNVQKTPPSQVPAELRPVLKQGKAYRSAQVIVPEPDRPAWAAQRLLAIGFEVDPDTMVIGPTRHAVVGRGARIPYVEITADGTVASAHLFAEAVLHGTGKGRNYGLGLIRIH